MSATQKVGRRLSPVPLGQVRIGAPFWTQRIETNRTVTIPLEYEINKKNGVLTAHQWDWWDTSKGKPPWRIIVGDLGKWIEAACYSLTTHPDEKLSELVESAVGSLIQGQKPDGYLYPNPIPREYRWANLQEYHELYEIGHDIEAAVAHYQTTGRRHLLDALCRTADLLVATFGREEGKIPGYDGHPEIELALVKLYRATGRGAYLDLAKFFVDQRGQQPAYFVTETEKIKKMHFELMGWFSDPKEYWYCQAHKPLRRQEEAAGHVVRAMYLYSGAADVAAETGDAELLEVCRRLWRSAARRRMYVIGGVGSSARGEAFTFDYDLPNETAYAETCSNISLALFSHRMLQLDADAEYADVMERALYNGVLSGISLDGRRFFYANHLTVYPGKRLEQAASDQVASVRQEWFGCACCPPNIARVIASLGQYAYSTGDDALYVHLYVGGGASCQVGPHKLVVRQQTEYPWKETVRLTVEPETPARFELALRIPGWCRGAKLKVNGQGVAPVARKGYARIRRQWEKGDVVELVLPMPVAWRWPLRLGGDRR